jgi:hypothetical protein
MQGIAVGSNVRVAERRELEVYLRSPDPRERPEPEQCGCAGRAARVVGVRLGAGRPPLYVLEGLPGLWPEAWLRPR